MKFQVVDYVKLEIYIFISFQWIIAFCLRNVIFKLDCKQVVDDIHLKSIRSRYDYIIDDSRVILSRHNMLCQRVNVSTYDFAMVSTSFASMVDGCIMIFLDKNIS